MSETAVAAPAKPASMGSAVPSSQGEIKVSKMSANASATTPKPAAATPSTAARPMVRDSMMENLRGRAKPHGGEATPAPAKADAKAAPATEAKTSGKPDPKAKPAGDEAAPGAEEEIDAQAPGEEVVADGEKVDVSDEKPGAKDEKTTKGEKGKVNPWKLVDEHKQARTKLEAEIAELRKLVADPEARKSELAKIEEVTKRNEELEKQIHFVDYSQSKEFKEKYVAPYEKKWSHVMSELKDVTISDVNGRERPVAPRDILELVNLPLSKANEKAEEMFGGAASVVMGYRAELRSLFQAKSEALEQAKTEGVTKAKQQAEEHQKQVSQIQTVVSKNWEEATKGIAANEATGHYFRPVEGDDQFNQRLEKGYKLIDDVMNQNPFDPKLSEDQRREVVKKHASVRARAAAFGALRHRYETLKKEHDALTEKLKGYEESEPGFVGEQKNEGTPISSGKASDSVFSALRKIAKNV